jgi:hypothetical protein
MYLREIISVQVKDKQEKVFDPNKDLRLDKIVVDEDEIKSEGQQINFRSSNSKYVYIDTEKFFSAKSNLIHKAKRIVLKEK